ncbi:hypothetical protein PGT21_035829 [Puccinia graminis f. sp. tritici]|uniref:Uncharacterized protein n=1 Tax=Puccinia graminis f. sp. tritici TaxID=56615 RepID=A0A5B0MN93_PUCGR|nr:hypothetical protein PGT21_035829 [Puccinia graminis f. sp. tritici]
MFSSSVYNPPTPRQTTHFASSHPSVRSTAEPISHCPASSRWRSELSGLPSSRDDQLAPWHPRIDSAPPTKQT